ncbi:MAG: DEAD/DEAH box helicase family protein, partial [Deltaproteobacteria bacterium]|nr:DEAD/DEAH box helicase family protein [Deltaproteobacteria bacterium]
MKGLSKDFIRSNIAASMPVFKRGVNLYENGSYICDTADFENGMFVYGVDGNYGDYTINIKVLDDAVGYECDCPFPGRGCKHVVASLLDVADRYGEWKNRSKQAGDAEADTDATDFLVPEEIRALALEDRKKRAANEKFVLTMGDMCKGEHLVETPVGRQYMVTLHNPAAGLGHCTCPDFGTNRLGTCKHILFVSDSLKKQPDFNKRIAKERFPFIDIFWDSTRDLPAFFWESPESESKELVEIMGRYFEPDGYFIKEKIDRFSEFLSAVSENKRVRIQENVIHRIDEMQDADGLATLADAPMPSLASLKTELYPYQKTGVNFALFKKGALIGDEMGLGKTLQAIVAAILKKQVFGFEKVVIVTLASLKEQWKREIEKFTDEKGVIIAGNPAQRAALYKSDAFFKITNYEAVLRDVLVISRFKPDLVILDEAQRIKNFNTKTADAVKQIPKKHAMVLTGTPLENKLEDVYSIVQFLDPYRLSPLWRFAADHFLISRHQKGRIVGYRNLGMLAEKLSPVVIRRKKEEVLSELPDSVVNNYFIDLSEKQAKMHAGYIQSLAPLLNKKYLTPMDMRKIQTLLLCMRRTCDSTYLIDRRTNISPKLAELEGIVDEFVRQNNRKVVIFS